MSRNSNIKVYNVYGEQILTQNYEEACFIDATACGSIEWESFAFFAHMMGYEFPEYAENLRLRKASGKWQKVGETRFNVWMNCAKNLKAA